jgi:hypothetical protein
MFAQNKKKAALIAIALTIALTIIFAPAPTTDAADHGDALAASLDRSAEITDVWTFMDPNDPNRLELIMGLTGFIVPGENANFGVFDSGVRFRFSIENTGDAKPDLFLDVTFTKRTAVNVPQLATITLSDGKSAGKSFTAPTTISSGSAGVAPGRNLTTDSATGIKFFAGLSDDPFFFDVPAELRYRATRTANRTDGSFFSRGRDTFAGYNINAIALSVPVSLLKGSGGNILGINGSTARNKKSVRTIGNTVNKGEFVQIDSFGIPAVNIVFVPFARKDEFNAKSPDSSSFASDIVASLKSLQTDDTSIGIFAKLAIEKGDYLRIDTMLPNTGPEGGNNPEARFPNGRRLNDDVTDLIVSLVNNRVEQIDNVNKNDKEFLGDFPWVAQPHQPLDRGVTDSTQN